MEKLNNIQNLDSILFYSGPDAVVAAEYTEGREFGSYVNGLGNTYSIDSDHKSNFM